MAKKKLGIGEPLINKKFKTFEEGKLPNVFLVPTSVWNNENNMFVIRNYDQGQKSKPKYGVNITNSNKELLEKYKFETMIKELM